MALTKVTGQGLETLSDGVTITTADNTTQLTLKSTDADATAGPRFDLTRDSGSPADGDNIGRIRYLFDNDAGKLDEEIAPKIHFSNPLKTIYYRYIVRLDPYNHQSVLKLLKKFKENVNIIKGNSNDVLKEIKTEVFDYVFLDGGHKYETVKNDLKNLIQVVNNNGTILCDDYNLSYAPGVRKAIDEYVLDNNFNLKILNLRFAEITKYLK